MLFLTVLLFMYYLISLLNGAIFKSDFVEIGELRIKLENKEISEKVINEKVNKLSLKLLCMLILLFILNLIYMIIALNHKEFALLSVVYYALYVLWNFISVKFNNQYKPNKLDLTKEEDKVKYRKKLYRGRTVRGTIWQLISLGYFGYIGYFLLFK